MTDDKTGSGDVTMWVMSAVGKPVAHGTAAAAAATAIGTAVAGSGIPVVALVGTGVAAAGTGVLTAAGSVAAACGAPALATGVTTACAWGAAAGTILAPAVLPLAVVGGLGWLIAKLCDD